jgi:hypothetical protein
VKKISLLVIIELGPDLTGQVPGLATRMSYYFLIDFLISFTKSFLFKAHCELLTAEGYSYG